MKQIFLISALLITVLPLFGQTPLRDNHIPSPDTYEVTLGNQNVSRDGTTLIIDYGLRFGDKVKNCDIDLFISKDGGITFTKVKEHLSGDIGRMDKEGRKQIKYDFSSIKNELAGKQLAFKIDVTHKNLIKSNAFIIANIGFYPYLSYGLMGGWVGSHAGVYVKARSNYKFAKTSCTSSGKYSGGGDLWTNGNESYSRLSVSGGVLFRITDNIFPYIGAGYGTANVLWGDYTGKWLTVEDYQINGISADLGLMFQFKHIALSAGVSTTAFKYFEGEIGIGYMF